MELFVWQKKKNWTLSIFMSGIQLLCHLLQSFGTTLDEKYHYLARAHMSLSPDPAEPVASGFVTMWACPGMWLVCMYPDPVLTP